MQEFRLTRKTERYLFLLSRTLEYVRKHLVTTSIKKSDLGKAAHPESSTVFIELPASFGRLVVQRPK